MREAAVPPEQSLKTKIEKLLVVRRLCVCRAQFVDPTVARFLYRNFPDKRPSAPRFPTKVNSGRACLPRHPAAAYLC